MASKYEIEEMLKQSIENSNRLSKHIEALWVEIGEKQTAYYDIKYELDETRSKHKECLDKFKEFVEGSKKHKKDIKAAQFQKEWIENFSYERTDN